MKIEFLNDDNRPQLKDESWQNSSPQHEASENNESSNMKQDNDVNQNMLQNLEEAISIIPEVDESNQTTEEKYKSKSPTWGRLKKSKRQEELDKIPFEIEDTKEPSKEIKFRIGSVKSKLNI